MNSIISGTRRSLALAALAACGAASTPALADWESLPLDRMIADADYVAVARVVDVAPGAAPGDQVATLALGTAFKGNPPNRFALTGAEADPGLPDFAAGTTVLAFWDAGDAGAPGTVIGREQGIAGIRPEQIAATRSLVETIVNRGADLRVADLLPFLQAGPPRVPVATMTAAIKQLDAAAKLVDRQAITRLACRPDDFQRAAAELGIALVGQLAIAEARPCLERQATTPGGGYAVSAVEALGNLADPQSLGALLSLVPERAPKPFPQGGDPVDETGPGPDDDPEEEGTPRPDPQEDGAGDPPRPVPEDRRDTGVDEPDGNIDRDDDADGEGQVPPVPVEEADDDPGVSDDVFMRDDDAGLTEAAVLALGKLRQPAAVPRIAAIAREGRVLGLHSTVVTALGEIGSPAAQRELRAIANSHPHPLVRELAKQTLLRLRG